MRHEMFPLEEWAELIEGKTVALVGNAESILDLDNGREIDGHDVVIRFNRVVVRANQERYLGARTTVLCGYDFLEPAWVLMGRPLILWRQPPGGVYPWSSWGASGTLRFQTMNIRLGSVLKQFFRDPNRPSLKPSTGAALAYFLTGDSVRPSLVSLYGFDHFDTPSWPVGVERCTSHDGEREKAWFEELGFHKVAPGVAEWHCVE